MKSVIVVGAGASGLMAAISAARAGASVTVLEGMEKPGKKLLVTGNGRCNLTNLDMSRKDCYRGAESTFVQSVLEEFPVDAVMDFFGEIGLFLKSRNGYIYPYTDQAKAVADALLLEARRLGIKVKCAGKVTAIEKEPSGFTVYTDSWKYKGEQVILAAGGKAASGTGSDGSGYDLARSLGHGIISPMPALVPLKIKETNFKKMAGLRMNAALTLRVDGMEICGDQGELQWTEYGISGIVVFQLSRYGVRALAEKKSVLVSVDLFPEMEEKALESKLSARNHNVTVREFLNGVLPEKAIPVLTGISGLNSGDRAENLSFSQIQKLSAVLKNLQLTITGSKSFDAAQVCSGGVDTSQIKEKTLESRICPGLYFAGEIMDVDGICGGYNLQWAWSSGYAAGTAAART